MAKGSNKSNVPNLLLYYQRECNIYKQKNHEMELKNESLVQKLVSIKNTLSDGKDFSDLHEDPQTVDKVENLDFAKLIEASYQTKNVEMEENI